MGLMRGLRKNIKILYWVVIVGVGVPFLLWGTRVGLRGGRKHAGIVFGKKVSTEEFRRQWQAARERAIEIEYQRRQVVTPEQVEDMAWRRVVELREAERWGITVPMSEVKERIRLMFSREGVFDETVYQNYLYRRGMTEEQFASILRDDMKIGILERLVVTTAVVPPQEVRDEFDYEQEQRKIKFHMVETEPLLAAFEVSDEGEQYYRAHEDEFREPRKVAVQYVMVETNAFLEQASVAEEELKEYYEEYKSSYKGADGKTASFDEVRGQIERLLKNRAADRMAQQKAEEVLVFSEASKMRGVAEKNGLAFAKTGLLPEEGPASDELAEQPEFRKVAFATPIGEVSPIVKTDRGYCVLSPIRLVPERIPPFEEVRKEAAEKQRAQRLKDAANRAGIAPDQVEEFVKGFSVIPPEVDVTHDEALRYYSSRQSEFRKPKKVKVQYIMVEKAPFEKEVKVTEKEIKREYEDNQRKYKDEEEEVKPLDEVREEIEKALRERKADEKAQERADEIFTVYRPQSLKELARKHGLKLRESRLFSQGEMIDDYVGESLIFASVAHRTAVGEISSTFSTDMGYCVLSPVQVVEQGVSEFEDVAEEAAEKAKKDKAERLVGQIARELHRQVRENMTDEEKDFETACKEVGLNVEESGYFRRDDRTIENVGATMMHTSSIFRDEPGKIGYPRRIPKGYFFYVVSEVKPPSEEEFVKEKDSYYNRLAGEKGREAFSEWLIALMEEANVKSYFRPPPEKRAEKGAGQ